MADAQSEEAHCRRESPSIDYFVHTFLDNTKARPRYLYPCMLLALQCNSNFMQHRFGEHSVEVTTINSILSSFRSGNISKRDALSSITLALGNQQDLKQDLMNVLHHQDAKWGDGDFDFDQTVAQSVTPTYPQFLQPARERPLRLPPISTSWCLNHQAVQSINPAVLSGYGGPANIGYQEYDELAYAQRGNRNWQPIAPTPPSPMLQMHTNYQLLDPFALPAFNRSTSFSRYTGANYDVGPSSVHRDSSRIPQRNHMEVDWANSEYEEGKSLPSTPNGFSDRVVVWSHLE